MNGHDDKRHALVSHPDNLQDRIVGALVRNSPPAAAAAMGSAAGGVGGAGLGAALGVAVAGPPGAAVGYLGGLTAGMLAGMLAGAAGANKVRDLINNTDGER